MESFKNEKEKWDEILKREGLGEKLPPIFSGEQVSLGDGLGRNTEKEEELEDCGEGHSRMCPLNLGHAMEEGKLDQPNDASFEDLDS